MYAIADSPNVMYVDQNIDQYKDGFWIQNRIFVGIRLKMRLRSLIKQSHLCF